MAQIKRIVKRRTVVSGKMAEVWVGLGEMVDDDTTLPVVTFEYLTKTSLTDAIGDGSAYLPEVSK